VYTVYFTGAAVTFAFQCLGALSSRERVTLEDVRLLIVNTFFWFIFIPCAFLEVAVKRRRAH
jgi:hypothetical protein